MLHTRRDEDASDRLAKCEWCAVERHDAGGNGCCCKEDRWQDVRGHVRKLVVIAAQDGRCSLARSELDPETISLGAVYAVA